MNYTKDQFDKLPKWAQSEITRLERNVNSLTKKINEFSGEAETNTFLFDGLDKMPLQNNAHIEFRVGEKQCNHVAVYIRSDGTIDVNADSGMGQQLCILPRASNSFYITFK